MKNRRNLGLAIVLGAGLPSFGWLEAGEFGIRHNMPPASRLAEPGPMVGGPGPGVLAPETIPANGGGGGGMGMAAMAPKVQVIFNLPESMQILYDIVGDNTFTSDPLVVPGRLEFPQGGIYRMKLTQIEGRPGVELYPTLEIAMGTPRTSAYLAHNAVPVQFTDEDFEQALSSNFVTKVIYLPDPEFQGDAIAGIDTLTSTRLEPGLDPIIEADRRGSILAIIRLGNKDVELSGPSMGGDGSCMMMGGMMCGPGGGGMMIGPDGMPMGSMANAMSNPPNNVAGVTAPQYGLTYSGTPIGLPGPPHIPLGHPAGLQQHIMRNHTHMSIPDPVEKMKIHLRHQPGYSYPTPPSRAYIKEQNIHPGYPSGRPHYEHASRSVTPNQFGGAAGSGESMVGAGGDAYCPPTMVR
jgi:hypothetical protein